MFQTVSRDARFPDLETHVLKFWKERQIYEKSLAQRADAPPFVFYEGPPTANGLPHPGHCLTRAIKDLFPRYRTMRGFLCQRKGGWDTHGLPVEVEVCKELGIHSKEQIEEFGVEPFIHKCQHSVWRYIQEWERLTERLGFWIHLDEAYVTYRQSYVESVWWSLKNLFDRGLLYQGHKIVWWWAQGGTALSSGEVGQGYREVDDPSVFVKCPLVDKPDTSLLVWTTTPWTLPSNQFVAVHPNLDYSVVTDGESDEKLVIASSLVDTISQKVKRELTAVSTCRGEDLVGQRYVPPFDYYHGTRGETVGTLRDGGQSHVAWRVVAADFVTVDSGTGLVHQAPAFGEVDYEVLQLEQDRFAEGEGPKLVCAVGPDGKFTSEAPPYEGRWVKEADKDIVRQLRSERILYHLEQYRHEYPFCWRSDDDPLIQYPRKSWFIRTTAIKERMLANNGRIHWLPDHIREGRFGNFLESNVDWALSRERYWGTPLPIWVCDETGKKEAIGSYQELLDKPGVAGTDAWDAVKQANPDAVDDLRVHKPYVDAITYDSPFAPGSRMRRVPEVIDCWYDAGAMPFAQWGYPHEGRERFESQFPADFISEALDQTRGWFYSLVAISTLLFSETGSSETELSDRESPDTRAADTVAADTVAADTVAADTVAADTVAADTVAADTVAADTVAADTNRPALPYPHPFRNCIVLGLLLGEDGSKMSKQKRNYREPNEIFERHGADALRWYFFANQPPWTSIRYSERAIKESIPEFLLRLWNVFSFFVIYANIDQFDPAECVDGEVGQLQADQIGRGRGYRPADKRSELDRWVHSELERTCDAVVQHMDAYDNFAACAALTEFVDGLSNWYVRRSRDRFWSKDADSADKLDAYWTLYECLVTTSKLVAPFVPFLAETLWQNLAGVFDGRAVESVHLCDFPAADPKRIDESLSQRMGLIREISSLGRSARMDAKLKVRQPLAKVEVILADSTHLAWLQSHAGLIQDELNVKQVEFTQQADQYITYQIQPNFKRLGPRVGRLMPKVKQALTGANGSELLAQMETAGKVTLSVGEETVELDQEDIQIRLQAKEGWAAAQGRGCVVVLSTELTDELVREGYARDLIRLIQDRRKDLDCDYTDRIEVGIESQSGELTTAVQENMEFIKSETLSVKLVSEPLESAESVDLTVAGFELRLYVKVVRPSK